MPEYLIAKELFRLTIEAAVVREQGVEFVVISVKTYVLVSGASKIEEVRSGFSHYFPGRPIILVAKNMRGGLTYHGKPDIVRFLTSIHPSQLPWKRYTFSD